MDFLKDLNGVQHAAVTTVNGPVLVIAGPGSGKTRVLTFRIAHLIQSGTPAYRILALTFTNKAAKSMKERIVAVVGQKAEGVWAGTFHSIFSRILRVEAEKLNLNANFTIYDADDAKSVIRDIVKTQGLDSKAYPDGAVYSRISLAKNNLISPEEYSMRHDYLQQDKAAKRPYIYKIYELYVKRCQQSSALDFDDLLYKTYHLLKANPDIADKYRKRFPFVLVDEFQDTNHLQYSIVQLLVNYPGSPRNITVVGDDAQSIYAFRGATIQNILDYSRDYPDLQTFKLEQNYRSTQPIVQAANLVIAHNKKQLQKTIFTDKIEGDPIRVLKTLSDEEEGRRVADHILELKTRQHLRNSDICILYRTNSQSRVFEEALTHYRIPFRVYGGLSFFQRKEVKDLLGYLRLCVNPLDAEALRRVINYPRRGIGDKTIEQLSTLATEKGVSMAEVALKAAEFGLPSRAATPIHEFMLLIQTFRQRMPTMTAYDFAMHVFRVSGLSAELKQDISVEGVGRIENANALLDGIRAFEENLPNEESTEGEEQAIPTGKLALYLQNISLLTDMDNENNVDDHVKMMSVHAAKGLEFEAVFVAGLEENLFPSFMAMQNAAYFM
jgi:DNA helicase II / ATP-dependent DNA helicase PcrA